MTLTLWIVFFLIKTLHLYACFSIKNICLNKNTECYGSYELNSKCEHIKCFGQFNYQCGFSYCTTDKKSCLDIYSSGLFTEYIPSIYSKLLRMKKYKKVI